MRISLTTLIHVLYDIFSWVWILIWFLFVCVVATSVCRFLYLSHDPCHLQPRSAHPLVNRHHGDRVLYKNYFLCWRAGLQSIQRIGVCVCVCVFNDPMLSLSQPDKPHPYSSSDVIYNAHKLTHTHTHSSSSITSLQKKSGRSHTQTHPPYNPWMCVSLVMHATFFATPPKRHSRTHILTKQVKAEDTWGKREVRHYSKTQQDSMGVVAVLLKDRGTLQRFAGPCGGSGWNSSLSTPQGLSIMGTVGYTTNQQAALWSSSC